MPIRDRLNPPLCTVIARVGRSKMEIRVSATQALLFLDGETVFPPSTVVVRDLNGKPLKRDQLVRLAMDSLNQSMATVLTLRDHEAEHERLLPRAETSLN